MLAAQGLLGTPACSPMLYTRWSGPANGPSLWMLLRRALTTTTGWC
jgi:hypothetical protein